MKTSWKWLAALAVLLCLAVPETAWSQRPRADRDGAEAATDAAAEEADADADDRATPGATASSRSRPRRPGQFPPVPQAFYRGNTPTDGGGWYLNLFRLVPVLALLSLWFWTGNWVDEDSQALKVRSDFWNSWVLLGGIAGFLGVLTLPSYFLGFVVLLCGYAAPVGLYVKERNRRVPEPARLLTRRHLKLVGRRLLSRIGIQLGPQERGSTAAGPPIRFIQKTSGPGGDSSGVRARQVESSRGFMAARELVYDAILRRATDVHLEPKEDELAVRLRIDGVMYPAEPFDRSVGDAVVNIFKVLSAMDITERRRPQDGSFRAETEGREVDFRVATQGTRHGEKMSLRILDQGNSVSRLANIGMRKQLREQLTELINQPHGLLLVCGPTGAGKSTTLYAALNEIDAYQRNIITVEDPVEYRMDNVNQIEINTRTGQTFGSTLRSILRQDPDVVMIGEIRDPETAGIACQAANTGHMVFSTVHANDTITALYRFLELDVEPFMVANSVSGILAQRLARRLCSECREAYRPNPEFLKKAGLSVGRVEKFYRPPREADALCSSCAGLGFKGRIGVFELLTINDRLRDLIREKAPVSAVKAEARKNGMLYMKEEGIRLVVRGITSIDELLRVVK